MGLSGTGMIKVSDGELRHRRHGKMKFSANWLIIYRGHLQHHKYLQTNSLNLKSAFRGVVVVGFA